MSLSVWHSFALKKNVSVKSIFQLFNVKKSDLFKCLRGKDIFIQTSETRIEENHCNEQETCSWNELSSALWAKCSNIPECVQFRWIKSFPSLHPSYLAVIRWSELKEVIGEWARCSCNVGCFQGQGATVFKHSINIEVILWAPGCSDGLHCQHCSASGFSFCGPEELSTHL